jgi:hypothetical protein
VGGDRIRRIYATGDAAIASMCPNLLQNAPRLAPEETNDRDDGDKLVAASRTLIKAIETGQSARRLADVIMIDRNAAAAALVPSADAHFNRALTVPAAEITPWSFARGFARSWLHSASMPWPRCSSAI